MSTEISSESLQSKRPRIEHNVSNTDTGIISNLFDPQEGSSVGYHVNFPAGPSSDMQLIEMSPEVADAISSGEKICIRGSLSKSDAVLCTRTRTFTMKKVETSNAVYVVPPAQDHQPYIISHESIKCYYEVFDSINVLV
jgi:hypothetical protein